MKEINELKRLYSNASKHSNYQILPKQLEKLISQGDIDVKSRYEAERMKYFKNNVNFNNKTVLDIGGNSGYFTFESLDAGAKSVYYVEGNKEHAEFVNYASDLLGLQSKIKVTNQYYQFINSEEKYDIVLLLNVLHHLGDDYGDKDTSLDNAKLKMIDQLNTMADKCDIMIFQLGFNWHGNPQTCLFTKGLKKELIDFVKKGIEGFWEVEKIGIAEKTKEGGVHFYDLNEENIKRDDTLGEFLNRPIFILNSKQQTNMIKF